MQSQQPAKTPPLNLPQALALGVSLCRAGKFAEAEQLYRAVLQQMPRQFDALLNLGRILLHRREPMRALDLLRRAVSANPQIAEAHGELGNALATLGHREAAVGCYQQAIVLRPDDAEALAKLGASLQMLDRHEAAIDAYRKAIALKPHLPLAYNNLGAALGELGKLDEAIVNFREATTLDPNLAQAFDNLAAALHKQGQLEEAIAAYRRSIRLKPENAATHNRLAGLLQTLGRPAEAIEADRAALAIAPHSAPTYQSLGSALFHLNRHDEAVGCFQRAIALRPDYALAYANMGLTLNQLGREGEALAAFEKAVELAPETIEFHYNMSESKRFVPGDRQLAQLERLAETIDARPGDDQIKLHFTLGKAYDDLGEHRRAFEHLSAGNALMRRKVAHDDAASRRFFERVQSNFSAELMRAKSGIGHPSAAPVFILGMPRSGTTLVEQILAAHPRVFAAGELTDLPNAVAALKAPDERPVSYPELVQSIDRTQLFELGAAYVAGLPAPLPLPDRITDKMPGNFTLVGLIHLALPNARIVHVRRDPLDTCFSIFSKLFVVGHPYSYDLGELGRYYRNYERLMAHWNAVLPTGTMLEMRYEDLVGDLEGQARRIVAHCGLEWDDRCLAFQRAPRPVRTASFTQVRRPIYSTSIGRARPYQGMLGPLVKELAVAAPDSRRPPAVPGTDGHPPRQPAPALQHDGAGNRQSQSGWQLRRAQPIDHGRDAGQATEIVDDF